MEDRLTRIGIFYDGNYFSHVSNYYSFNHERRSRISIEGLHRFVRQQVAHLEGTDERYCQVVDAHYFRGRLSASEAQERDSLYGERLFDEVLMRAGVTTHYMPLSSSGEKGIDVWFALEAFELAMYKRFTVSVLVTGDGDYVPLVRKLNTLGTRVMLLGWDFEYIGRDDQPQTTRTSQDLIEEVTYPVLMDRIIEDRSRRSDPVVRDLFIPRRQQKSNMAVSTNDSDQQETSSDEETGSIVFMKDGWGFIEPDAGGDNIYFFHRNLVDVEYDNLQLQSHVSFVRSQNEKGPCAVRIRMLSTL